MQKIVLNCILQYKKSYLCIVKISNMATVKFMYRSTRPKAFLEVRVQNKNSIWGGKTDILTTSDFWNNYFKVDKLRDVDLRNEQIRINDLCNKLETYLLEEIKKTDLDKVTDKDWLKTVLNILYRPESVEGVKTYPNGLIPYLDYYTDVEKEDSTEPLRIGLRVLKKKLQRFEEKRGDVILIKDVNRSFMKEFFKWSRTQNHTAGTMHKDLSTIKSVCLNAQEKGIEVSLELPRLTIDRAEKKKAKPVNIHLTFEEIEQIQKAKIPSELENIRDWLIISCFTGQRVSDFLRFNSKMVRMEQGRKVIDFTQQKTNAVIGISLHPKIIEILDKRGGEFPEPTTHPIYNRLLKDLCQIAELNEKVLGSKLIKVNGNNRRITDTYYKWEIVSSHIGRRSYASNFYGTIPTPYLMAVTGHKTESTFIAYVGKDPSELAKQIHKYY
jgi:hypothetical protein